MWMHGKRPSAFIFILKGDLRPDKMGGRGTRKGQGRRAIPLDYLFRGGNGPYFFGLVFGGATPKSTLLDSVLGKKRKLSAPLKFLLFTCSLNT